MDRLGCTLIVLIILLAFGSVCYYIFFVVTDPWDLLGRILLVCVVLLIVVVVVGGFVGK